MKIVVGANCFISYVKKKSPYWPVLMLFLEKKYMLCLSSNIVLEYEEKFLQFLGMQCTILFLRQTVLFLR